MDLVQGKKLEQVYVFPTYRRQPLMLERGEGPWVYDADGRRYLDFLCGLGVTALGHAHPDVVEAIRQQAGKLSHVSNLYYTEPGLLAAREICRASKMSKAFFGNSGAEANEAAIKLARLWGKKVRGEKCFEIVTFTGAFHGRTLATLTATGNPAISEGFEPLARGFVQIPFNDVKALRAAASDKTCAVMLEPIQGESGVWEMSEELAGELGALQEKKKILVIADEVQCGLGRTGRWFAHSLYGLTPDIMTLAKALGGGLPMGAMLAQGPVAELFGPGKHASTFGAGPIAAAASLAFFNVMKRDKLLANADRMGKALKRGVLEIQKRCGVVTEVRGRGLMIGIGVDQPAGEIAARLLEKGVMVNAVRDHTIRILPPFIIGQEEVDLFLEKFEKSVKGQ